jgi:hypothetical protein
MSDPPGLPSGLGIDSVEWFAEGEHNVTVRVAGRWRRRRPTWIGRPLLVIEEEGRRHRFPAMPEPPGVTGTAPGTWRMTFSVPASLAQYLRGSAWLKLGVTVMPLPVDAPPEGATASASQGIGLEERGASEEAFEAQRSSIHETPGEGEGDETPGEGEGDGDEEPGEGDGEEREREPDQDRQVQQTPGPDPGTIAARRLRSAELALEAARSRLADAEERAEEFSARVERLESELTEAKREPERLSSVLSERERRRRAAEQRAYAERALREELEEELADRERELSRSTHIEETVTELRQRVAELASDLEDQRRRADEAEQAAAAASVARSRAEQQLAGLRAEVGSSRPGPGRARLAATTRTEHELALASRSEALPQPAHQPAGRHDTKTLELERAMVTAWANAGERIVALERELEDQKARMRRVYKGIEAMRLQLEAVRLERERELQSASPGVAVEPDRLGAALERLRAEAPVSEEQPHPEPEPEPERDDLQEAAEREPRKGRKPWLGQVFRSLAEEDAAAAGALAVELLPALRLVVPHEQKFDLVLDELGRMRVSVHADRVETALTDRSSEDDSPAFVITGDLAELARLLTARRFRRRVGRRRAKVRGNRKGVAALQELVGSSVQLGELHAVGVSLDPWLTFRVVSLMVKPAWTRGERFTMAYREPRATVPSVLLRVLDGRRPVAARTAPLSAADATVVCEREALIPVLDGERIADLKVEGDRGLLELVQDWVKLAQSD